MNQLAIAFAEADRGIKRAKRHAEAIDPEWSKTALAMLGAYCIQHRGESFTSESFRSWCDARHFPIPVPKALGHTFQAAQRAGLIGKNGFERAAERHGSPTVRWLCK